MLALLWKAIVAVLIETDKDVLGHRKPNEAAERNFKSYGCVMPSFLLLAFRPEVTHGPLLLQVHQQGTDSLHIQSPHDFSSNIACTSSPGLARHHHNLHTSAYQLLATS